MPDSILIGRTVHERYSPVLHRFSYPINLVYLSLFPSSSPTYPYLLGYNTPGLFTINTQDYLYGTTESLWDQCKRISQEFSYLKPFTSLYLVTIPRLLLPRFKPLSFFLFYRDQSLLGALAEVTNTYKERYFYALDNTTSTPAALRFTCTKTFHVSPFFNEEGHYHFIINDTAATFSCSIVYYIDTKRVFMASVTGKRFPLSNVCLLKTACTQPISTALALPRIYWQAGVLYYKHAMPVLTKPPAPKKNMLAHMPLSWLESRTLDRLKRVCAFSRHQALLMTFPDGTSVRLGHPKAHQTAQIHIHHNWFFRELLHSGEIGLGESYMKGLWDSPDISAVVSFFIEQAPALKSQKYGMRLFKWGHAILHRLNRNSRKKAKENIAEHYDLGNDFYRLFLDASMTYSAAYFTTPSDSLETAQQQKYARLAELLNPKQDQHILEIGSGWGSMALFLARTYHCKVTTLTLSTAQYNYVTQRLQQEGLADRVSVQLCDYRDIKGTFDHVVSIEMIEAVGARYLPIYFKTLNSLLKPGGRIALQAIIYPDASYAHYTRSSDFIRKHIFPGGHLPSLGHITHCLNKETQLQITDRFNIASSYARTLSQWHDRFINQETVIKEMGFNTVFFRKWCYYFKLCEAAFNTDYLATYQLQLQKKQ